jgi:hypothetical protein
MTKILKMSGIFVGGIIIGGVLMNLLHMHIRPVYRDTIRIDLKTEQEFLASRAARYGDKLRAASHRWNVVDLEADDGFHAFREERNKDDDSSLLFPFNMLVLKGIASQMGEGKKKIEKVIEGVDRGKLAVALESIGEKEKADKQWEIARVLTIQKSLEDIRRLVLRNLEHEKTDLYLQAEKAILEDNEANDNQPNRK